MRNIRASTFVCSFKVWVNVICGLMEVIFGGATGGGNEWQSTGFVEHWDFWRPENDPLGANTDAYYPRVAFNGGKNTNVQTRYLQNGAYLRLKKYSAWIYVASTMDTESRYVICTGICFRR